MSWEQRWAGLGAGAPIQEGETAGTAALTEEGMFRKQNRPARPEHQELRVKLQSTWLVQPQLLDLPFAYGTEPGVLASRLGSLCSHPGSTPEAWVSPLPAGSSSTKR